jgi:hypothetical protein
VAITAIAHSFLTTEEHQHTLKIGVSIGALGRRAPCPIVLLSVLYSRVLMAARH